MIKRVCLLASDKPICNDPYVEMIEGFIAGHNYWCDWWSYPIKKEAIHLLDAKPFYIYISNGKNGITHRFTVVDYVSNYGGSQGLVSPWPDSTQDIWKGVDRLYAPCKTWFRMSKFERLKKPLLKTDFTPIKGLSKENNLICRSTFGYTYKKQ